MSWTSIMGRFLIIALSLIGQCFIASAQEVHFEPIYRTEINGFSLGNVSKIGNFNFRPVHMEEDLRNPSLLLIVTSSELLTANPATGEKSSIAGQQSTAGYREGTGSDALFGSLQGFVQLSRDKILVLSSSPYNCIRSVNRQTNTTALVAGTCGKSGYVDGPLNKALFNLPRDIVGCKRNPGIFYVVDRLNFAIRTIDLYGNKVSTLFDFTNSEFTQPQQLNTLAIDCHNSIVYVAGRFEMAKIDLRTKELTMLIRQTVGGFKDGPLATAQTSTIRDMILLDSNTLLIGGFDGRLRIIDIKMNAISSVCNGIRDLDGVDGPIDQCQFTLGPTVVVPKANNSGIILSDFSFIRARALIRELSLTRQCYIPIYGFGRRRCHSDADCGGSGYSQQCCSTNWGSKVCTFINIINSIDLSYAFEKSYSDLGSNTQ